MYKFRYEKDFWFNNFTPDVIVKGKNDSTVSAYFKKNYMLSANTFLQEGKNPLVVIDLVMTDILGADVYYIGASKKRTLINRINKFQNLNIDPYTMNIQFRLSDGSKIILVESKMTCGKDLLKHCIQVQTYYDWKTKFLKGNKYRTHGDFIQHVHYPIAQELKVLDRKSVV